METLCFLSGQCVFWKQNQTLYRTDGREANTTGLDGKETMTHTHTHIQLVPR